MKPTALASSSFFTKKEGKNEKKLGFWHKCWTERGRNVALLVTKPMHPQEHQLYKQLFTWAIPYVNLSVSKKNIF